MIIKKWNGRAGTKLIWLRIEEWRFLSGTVLRFRVSVKAGDFLTS
jgi:hypothetical protein